MRTAKRAFTLLEVLISITLLSLVLMALYKSSDILRQSNKHLYSHLEHASDSIKGSQVLFMDILQSDGNILIVSDNEFHQLILEKTQHSFYGLPTAKVSWLVYKKDNTLLRVEGNQYDLPLKVEQNVEIEPIMKDLELFKIYRNRKNNKLLIIIKRAGYDPQTFIIQNVSEVGFTPKLVSPGEISRQNLQRQK